MPLTADRALIRGILETDREWAVYALADLAPPYAAASEWHVHSGAVLLVYRGFEPPVLFAHGGVAGLEPLLAEVAGEPEFYLSVRPEIAALVRGSGYTMADEKCMQRMIFDPRGRPPPDTDVERLGPEHGDGVLRLYQDGEAAGERPPFFDAGMLRDGIYYGIRERDEWVAAAGTHALAREESVAAIGNVYTRRDQRRKGFASRVTAAVAAALVRLELRTIALNVAADNPAARIYERIGFRRHCEYREGLAVKTRSEPQTARCADCR